VDFFVFVEKIFGRSLEVVYRDVMEICPFCKSKLNKNSTQKFLLNKNREIKSKSMFIVIKSV